MLMTAGARLLAAVFLLSGCAGLAPQVSPERVAEMRALEAESAARLAAEGEILFLTDPARKDGFQYCGSAAALLEEGELRRGIREASKALFLGQAARDEYLLAFAKRDLAYAYSLAGHLERAAEFAHDAMAHVQRAAPRADRSAVLGPARRVLGEIHLRQGRPREAIREFEESLAASAPAFRPFVLASLGNAHLAAGEARRAAALFAEAEAGARASLLPVLRRGRGEVALREGRYDDAAREFGRAAAEAAGPDQAYHRLWAFEGVGRARRAAGDRAGALAASRDAMAAAEQLRARFRSEEFKTGFFGDVQRVFDDAVALLMEGGHHADALLASERGRSRALLDQIRDRVTASAGGAAFADPLGRPVSLATLTAAVPDGTALVEFHVLPRRTHAWIVRKSGLRAVTVEISRESLARQVTRFREAIQARKPETQELAAALHRQLLAPLGLASDEGLVIVPHDALHYLPFQALRSPSGYLIQAHAVSYAPSAAAFVALAGRARPSREQVLALGNPDLGSPRLALPAAQREVERIKGLYPAAQVYVQREATKERVLTGGPKTDVLHIAAHAQVDEIDPLYSVIRLARTEAGTGELEAHEVYRLDLHRSGLVALSACETGLGRVSRGDEVWGFTRSFLGAGAPALLVSLWPVEDEATGRLMARLYEELRAGRSARDALRAAQRLVLAEERTGHPFYWAPFVLVGDGR